MADSVGQIGLDIVVNKNGFNKQISGITGLAKKAGAVLAGALAVKGLINFGKQCLTLGSDLAEVQNVVDVTFTQMNGQLNEFAKTAATAFGLSETMAKRYAGTFGAMSKAFGFTEKQAYDMSTALTGLTGDVASFYNISQDEAYTKLKSVFTGETESLKDLGVVMTQAALDQFALSNGFAKTTKEMTEQEKVALRFAFVQKQLALASGDFARTSDSWANQTRILKLQFDSLKASLGQGFIAILTPVIKVINTIMGKLVSLANTFRDFVGRLMGVEVDNSSGMGAVAGEVANATTGMEGLEGATDGVGSSAKKAAKEIKGLMGFDETHSLDDGGSDSGGSAGDTSGIGGGSGIGGDKVKEESNAVSSYLDGLIEKAKELKEIFLKGFKIGLGEANFNSILINLDGIKSSLLDIFTSKEVGLAADKFIDTFVLNVGKHWGAITSIGITLGQRLFGGIDKYLVGNKDIIKNWIVSIFDISSEIMTISGDLSTAIADVFSVFGGETSQQIEANMIEVLASAFMGTTELVGKLGRDILNSLIAPFVENKDAIKEAIQNTLEPIKTVTGTVADFITESFGKLNTFYDEHIAPFFTSIKDGFSSILDTILDVYNNYIAPILSSWGSSFEELFNEHISPFLDKFLGFAGKVINAIKEIWERILVPFINWVIETIVPKVAPIIEKIGTIIFKLGGMIADIVGGIIETFGGIIDFLVGIFTLDWERTWDGVKSIFGGIMDTLGGLIKEPLNVVIGFINWVIGGLNDLLSFEVPDFLGGGTLGVTVPEIPYLAKGGIVSAPTLAMVGEAGKEAVIPLENNTQGLDLLANKLLDRMGGYSQESVVSGEVNLNVGVLVADDRGIQKLKIMLDEVAEGMRRGRRQ